MSRRSRTSQIKREREQKKRERQQKKAEKAARKSERRLGRKNTDSERMDDQQIMVPDVPNENPTQSQDP